METYHDEESSLFLNEYLFMNFQVLKKKVNK